MILSLILQISPFASEGYRAGQVRVIFSLKKDVCARIFPAGFPVPDRLAYIEWFKPFAARPERHHLMYKISRAYRDATCRFREASVVPLATVKRSLHLYPVFGPVVPREWTSDNVLEQCNLFYVNPFTDNYTYNMI